MLVAFGLSVGWGSWSAHGAWVGLSHRTEFRRTSDVQMQAQADDLLPLPDALPDGRYLSFACTAAPSPPPGPPSPASSVTDAAPDSLPPDPLACSLVVTAGQPLDQQAAAQNVRVMELGKAPLSWAEADQEFYASASGQANVATSAAGPSGSSAAQESFQLVETFSGTLLEGFSLAPLKRPALPVQTTRKEASTKRGDRQPVRPAKKRERSSSWIRELAQRWHALPDAEKAKHMRWNAPRQAPSPAPAGVGAGAPATVAGAAIGVDAAIVVGVGVAAPSVPAPPPSPLPAAAPLLGLAQFPTAASLPAPFPAAAPAYPLAVDQIELAYRLAASRMAEAGRLAETAVGPRAGVRPV